MCSVAINLKSSTFLDTVIMSPGNSPPRIPLSRLSSFSRASAARVLGSLENTTRSARTRSRAPQNHRANTSNPGVSLNRRTMSAAALCSTPISPWNLRNTFTRYSSTFSHSSSDAAESPNPRSLAIDNSGWAGSMPANKRDTKQVSRLKLHSSDKKASIRGVGSSADQQQLEPHVRPHGVPDYDHRFRMKAFLHVLQQFPQNHDVVGKRKRYAPTPFRLAAVKRGAHSTIPESLQDRFKVSVIKTQSVKEENQHVRAYLVVHVAQVIANDPWIEGCSV